MFDAQSVYRHFATLGFQYDGLRDALLGWVQSCRICDPYKVSEESRELVENGRFFGTLSHLHAVGTQSDGELVAYVVGYHGLDPEMAQTLASAIREQLRRNGHEFNIDSWQLLSGKTIKEMTDDLHGYVLVEALGDPCREPNLRHSLITGTLAVPDLRQRELVRMESLRRTAWVQTETVPMPLERCDLVFRGNQSWVPERNKCVLEREKSQQARPRIPAEAMDTLRKELGWTAFAELMHSGKLDELFPDYSASMFGDGVLDKAAAEAVYSRRIMERFGALSRFGAAASPKAAPPPSMEVTENYLDRSVTVRVRQADGTYKAVKVVR